MMRQRRKDRYANDDRPARDHADDVTFMKSLVDEPPRRRHHLPH